VECGIPNKRTKSTGHQGRHGHEFLEFEYDRGRLRYANNSNYRNDSLIRKESTYLYPDTYTCWLVQRIDRKVWISPLMAQELRNIVESSEILKYVLIMISS